MLKKPLLLIGLFGILLIIAGFIFSPSFLGSFTASGTVRGLWSLLGIGLFRYFAVVFGVLILLGAAINNFLPSEKRSLFFLFSIPAIGLVLAVMGLILSPQFLGGSLGILQRLNDAMINSIYYLQLGLITAGCLIIFVSLLYYLKRFSVGTRRFIFSLLPLLLLVYIILIYSFYINVKYPSNVFTKAGTFSKISDLLLGRDILLTDFEPETNLKTKHRKIIRAKYPVIDWHFHLYSDFFTGRDKELIAPGALAKSMDSVGVKMICGLDGMEGEIESYQKKYPGHFLIFTNILLGPSSYFSDEFLAGLPEKLEKFVKMGVKGIGEFPKDLGLKLKDSSGKLLALDDPRLDPLYAKAAELGIPFLWHTTDPTPFFQRTDRFNERYRELSKYPQWSYYGPQFPDKQTLMKQKENVLKKHPDLIVVGAHFDWMTDDYSYLEYLLNTYPNYYIEFGSTLSEIGRKPFSTREFFIKYQDRILFGTDGGSLFINGWTVENFYQRYFEFLETDNEYFDYPLKGAINQGDWKIYGINLPDEVLEKIYYKNSERILFGKK